MRFQISFFLIFLLIVSILPLNLFATDTQKNPGVDSVNILQYTLNLDVTNMTAKKIKGLALISVTSNYPSVSIIHLNLLKLSVDSVFVNENPSAFFYNDTNISIPLSPGISQQDTLVIKIYYQGVPKVEPYGWGGFHFSGNSVAYNLGIALKENPPNYGRVWFPCIDNFTEKSPYDFIIKVNDPLKAICNGNLIEILPQGNGTSIYHWHLEEEIPAYLASVAIGNYIAVRDTFHGMNGSIPTFLYVRPQDSVKALNSFINLNQALLAFENHFGPYRWSRVGYVSTNLGAMEHATNIAYPTSSIDGTLNNETLYAHELSHMWFGDLTTCASPEDMWINEGWATFSEGIFKEGVYGVQAMKDYVRKKHHEVLQLTHYTDGGYYPLYGIPSNLTYGSTIYDKGAVVVHSLRGTMGDSLFFSTVKQYVDSFAYQSINTQQLRDFFTTNSGMNLTDFFDTWVYNPGFPHFSIDSVKITPAGLLYDVTVFVRQRMKGTNHISSSNILEVGFAKADKNLVYDRMTFSGLTGSKTFHLNFSPIWTGLDPNEKIADATTDNYKNIISQGSYNFPDTYFTLDATTVTDTAMVRIIHNWVAPDPLPQPVPGLTLSESRYWTVEGIIPHGFIAKGRFSYYKFSHLDEDIIQNTLDSIVLLYRPSCAYPWQSVDFTKNGVPYQGELIVDTLRTGEYCLAMWDHDFIGIQENNKPLGIRIAPNPASKYVNIYLNTREPKILKIYDRSGALVDSLLTESGNTHIKWSPSKPKAGLYLFQLCDKNNSLNDQIKAILLP